MPKNILSYSPYTPLNAFSQYAISEFKKLRNGLDSKELQKIIDNDVLITLTDLHSVEDVENLEKKTKEELPQIILALSNTDSDLMNKNKLEIIRNNDIKVESEDKEDTFWISGTRYGYSTALQITLLAYSKHTIFSMQNAIKQILINQSKIKYDISIDYEKSDGSIKTFSVQDIGSLRFKNVLTTPFNISSGGTNGFIMSSVTYEIDDMYFDMSVNSDIGILKTSRIILNTK